MVQIKTCANGVRIVSEPMAGRRAVAIGIWVKAGSRFESSEENGITHFIEHMLFKGTTTRSAKQIAESFDRMGGDLNAFTSRENTCYHATILDTYATEAITILADMFFHSRFADEDIAKEQQVVLEEILMDEDAPDELLADKMWHNMYQNHALGAPILGTAQTVLTFTAEKIRQYMRVHYTPQNIVVSLAGNVTEQDIALVEKLFGNFTVTSEPQEMLTMPQFTAVEQHYSKDIEQAHLLMSFKTVSRLDEQAKILTVFDTIVGATMSSRLFQEVRENRGLAYSVYSYTSCYMDTGVWTVYGATKNEQLAKLQQTIVEVLTAIKNDGITQAELTQAKQHLQGSLLLGQESVEEHMQRNGEIILLGLTHRTIEETLAKLDAITLAQVNDFAKAMLQTDANIATISGEVD